MDGCSRNKKRTKGLLSLLDELHIKYCGKSLSEEHLAVYDKKMAESIIHYNRIQLKNKTNPLKDPESYLKLISDLNERDLLKLACIFDDLADVQKTLQIPITFFTEEREDIEWQDSRSITSLRLSDIRALKKGLNGHC